MARAGRARWRGRAASSRFEGDAPTNPVTRAARAALALLALPCYSSAADAPRTAHWRVTQAEVRVLCPLTVGGSFEARTSSLADFAIARPQYLGVGVENEVQVRVTLVATPAAAGAAR
jgi:hypothetical protein